MYLQNYIKFVTMPKKGGDMKLLGVKATGLPLFNDDIRINFIATDKIYEYHKDNLYKLFNNTYINPTNLITGINASGKTSVLKLISLALDILQGLPINYSYNKTILEKSKKACLSIYFYSKTNHICKLDLCIIPSDNDSYLITSEKFYRKKATNSLAKSNLFDFSKSNLYADRKDVFDNTNIGNFLPDDTSITLGINKMFNDIFTCTNTMPSTNYNLSSILNIAQLSESELLSIINFLDPNIKRFIVDKDKHNNPVKYTIQYSNNTRISVYDFNDLDSYLSAGTIKGLPLFSSAISQIHTGGYIIVDELENHFNEAICSAFIQLFTNRQINKKGAILIFSTHYPELLDSFDRADNIYITTNTGKITVDKMSTNLRRKDIKKSEIYRSGYCMDTQPSYDAYLKVRNIIKNK